MIRLPLDRDLVPPEARWPYLRDGLNSTRRARRQQPIAGAPTRRRRDCLPLSGGRGRDYHHRVARLVALRAVDSVIVPNLAFWNHLPRHQPPIKQLGYIA